MAEPNLVPRTNKGASIGTALKQWAHGFFGDVIIDGHRAATLVDAYPRLTSALLSAPKTLTETPAALFAGASELSGRCWLSVRNESTDTRLRFGALQANLQRDGEILEPGAVVVLQLDPGAATTIYGCSEGRSITAIVGEDAP